VIKKMLLVLFGFAMITAGIGGITTSLVDRKNQAALQQIEMIQNETRTAVTEEQRKLEEKQREIDRLAMRIESERLHLQEDRRRLAQRQRSRIAAIEKRKRTATEPKTATRKDYVKGKAEETGKKPVLSSPPSPTTQASRPSVHEENVSRIAQKAGLEAARSFAPVEYYNRNTRELVLAEPAGRGPGSVLVRVRVSRGNTITQDTLINFSKASLGDRRGYRSYL
jgi:hypothetical protein